MHTLEQEVDSGRIGMLKVGFMEPTTKQHRDVQLALIMASMGGWLAGLVQELAATPEWRTKTQAQRASDLRMVVVNHVGRMSAKDDRLFKTYFHESGGTWEVLLAEVMNTHGLRSTMNTRCGKP